MKKGFTLIELLVVIAIIGILASVVLVSVGSARKRAHNAEVQAEIQQIRYEAEMFYMSGNTYTAFTVPVQYVKPSCATTGYTVNIGTAAAAGSKIAIYGSLCDPSTAYYCVDSDGKVYTGASVPAAASGVCP